MGPTLSYKARSPLLCWIKLERQVLWRVFLLGPDCCLRLPNSLQRPTSHPRSSIMAKWTTSTCSVSEASSPIFGRHSKVCADPWAGSRSGAAKSISKPALLWLLNCPLPTRGRLGIYFQGGTADLPAQALSGPGASCPLPAVPTPEGGWGGWCETQSGMLIEAWGGLGGLRAGDMQLLLGARAGSAV